MIVRAQGDFLSPTPVQSSEVFSTLQAQKLFSYLPTASDSPQVSLRGLTVSESESESCLT